MLLASVLTARGQESSVFGRATQSEAAMMGVLYDFKQTPDRRASPVTPTTYSEIIEEFLLKNWDERVFNRYYRVTRPLYTTQIYIPTIDASLAPRAFGVEKLVQPSLWVIHYKAQVSAPSAGSWRFVGASDDMLAVAVNQKTVLVANRFDTLLPNVKWRSPEPPGARAANNPLRIGDWIQMEAGQIIDLDVIIGERPGSGFNAFLMVEKKGGSYDTDSSGHKILPVFQVAPFKTPKLDGETSTYQGPVFARDHPAWISYQ